MKLYIVRHGRTVDNAKFILQGHRPGKLSKEGLRQAEKVAERLKDIKFDVIYSSDLKRVVDTAEKIIVHHEAPIYFKENLRERNLGSYQGKIASEVDWDNLPADVETIAQLYERVARAVGEIYKKHPQENVLIISHGGFGRVLHAIILGIPVDRFSEVEKPKNTSVYIYELKDGVKGKIILENCVKHLEEI
ncbi:MAG: histidine phosphatase family protein [Candidatus Moranbacteria bacterium]|nr:histidine phosphatase family protein [Candidatus Moranbacteria bacterium]